MQQFYDVLSREIADWLARGPCMEGNAREGYVTEVW